MVIDWIDEEINFIQIATQLIPPRQKDNTINSKDYKLHTTLSVAQLACFIRLMTEEKLIANPNQTEVIGFFAEHFRTDKSENISAESLRSKYYTIEGGTSNAVKDILIHMMNHIRKL